MGTGRGYFGGTLRRSNSGGTHEVHLEHKEHSNMAGSDRPGGMDSIPSKFNVGKKQGDTTDMGKVANISHVKVKDRGVKGVSGSDKGGGRK